jgi:general secretion pathway protein A
LGENSTPCFYAQQQGLSCLQGRADIDLLRKLNLPAVLKFYDDFKEPNYVALLELGEATAKISLGDKRQTISLEQLAFYWQGEFSLLWRMPPGYVDSIRPSASGKAVLWLNEALNKIDGTTQAPVTNRYDAALYARVKRFQSAQGLSSDGVVGARTIIRINQILGLVAPVLEPMS